MAHKQKSFTLIEMLIVVVIIGILAAALIPRLQSVQARARDTKRKADLHQIGTALEIYKQDNGSLTKIVYEKTLGQVWQIGDGTYMVIPYTTAQQFYQWDDARGKSVIATNISNYMTAVPTDPDLSPWYMQDASYDSARSYGFAVLARNGSAGQAFVLGARTESDWSSSNRVTNTNVRDSVSVYSYPLWAWTSETSPSDIPTDTRIGSIIGRNAKKWNNITEWDYYSWPWDMPNANLYEKTSVQLLHLAEVHIMMVQVIVMQTKTAQVHEKTFVIYT